MGRSGFNISWDDFISIFFLKMQTNEKPYAKSKLAVWGFSFCFPSNSYAFASIFLLLEPWEQRGNMNSVGGWYPGFSQHQMLVIRSKSRRQTKTSLVCVFSEMQRTGEEQIFHVSHLVCMHSAVSNRADFFYITLLFTSMRAGLLWIKISTRGKEHF